MMSSALTPVSQHILITYVGVSRAALDDGDGEDMLIPLGRS